MFSLFLFFALRLSASARAEILGIHTRGWAEPSRPPRGLISELAARTAGYGGADLKALTAEASLRALRRTFPQIYESETRVQDVDAERVVVRRRDGPGGVGSKELTFHSFFNNSKFNTFENK